MKIKKVRYTREQIWDMIIELGDPDELALKMLAKNLSKADKKVTLNNKTLTALVANGHISVDKTLKNEDWRINHLYCVRDKDGDIVTFKRNRAQEDFAKNAHTRNVILKSRQLGFSTDALIKNWDATFWNPYQNNLIIAHKIDDAKKLFRRIEFAYNTMPDFLRELVYLKSKTTEQMEIGFDKLDDKPLSEQPGKVLSTISVSTSGRSDALSRGHISELAYIDRHHPDKSEEIQRGTIPALPHNGRLDIESTSQGNTGLFASIYRSASKNPSSNKDFKKFFYNWTWSEYDLAQVTQSEIDFVMSWEFDEAETFREYQEKHKLTDREIACYYSFWKSLGEDWDAVRREYPTTEEEALLNISDLVFSGEKLDAMDTKVGRVDGPWEFLKDPVVGHRYVIGADVGSGQGGDPSAAVIIDLESDEVVAIFEDKMTEPDDYAYHLAEKGRFYNTAYIAVERNNVGHSALQKLKEIYPDQQIHKEIKTGSRFDRRTTRYGWDTQGPNKPKMVADMKTALLQDKIELWSHRIIEQMRGYTREEIIVNKRLSVKFGEKHQNGAHFDLVDATMIAWQVRADALLYAFMMRGNSKMDTLKARRRGEQL